MESGYLGDLKKLGDGKKTWGKGAGGELTLLVCLNIIAACDRLLITVHVLLS